MNDWNATISLGGLLLITLLVLIGICLDIFVIKTIEAERMGNWISVKTRLPDQYGDYLATNCFDIQQAHYDNGDKWTFSQTGKDIPNSWNFSHWQPLPELPAPSEHPEGKEE